MIWIGYSAMWVSVSAAVVYAISITGKASPLWALIIPLFVSIKTDGKESQT